MLPLLKGVPILQHLARVIKIHTPFPPPLDWLGFQRPGGGVGGYLPFVKEPSMGFPTCRRGRGRGRLGWGRGWKGWGLLVTVRIYIMIVIHRIDEPSPLYTISYKDLYVGLLVIIYINTVVPNVVGVRWHARTFWEIPNPNPN